MISTPNEAQFQIISTTEGYQRCAAVPGSGKTYCLTQRIVYLIQELYVDPASIVALTFTNKAARSMNNRVKKMIGDEGTCFMGTFHGFCNKLLKEEIYKLSYPKTFTLLDRADQINMIREVAEELNMSLKDFTAKEYLQYIEEEKIKEEYIEDVTGPDKEVLYQKAIGTQDFKKKVYYYYLLRQRDSFALDFHDIISFAIYILTNHEDIKLKWQNRCQYVLCDEFQDVNRSQALLLTILSGKFHNLFVIGDDDQNIYGWRGSKSEYMIHFDSEYPDAQSFSLCENYRSSQEIVAVANSLIASNQNRLEKKMFTKNPSVEKPIYNCLRTEKEEALWIGQQILQGTEVNEEGEKDYSKYTILVRAASQTRALEESFMKQKIPYKILSGAQFYSSVEIKTVLSYLRMVYALNNFDFEQTINRPSRKFGKKSLKALREYSTKNHLDLFHGLELLINEGQIQKEAIIEYFQKIKELHGTHQDYSCKDLANKVLDMGYRQELQMDVDQTKLDNVAELISTIAEMEAQNEEWLSLEDLLNHFALFTNQDGDNDNNQVKIMTIHTAKGLEFNTVFVNGLVEGNFPSKRLRNEDEYEEERRLFYVAVTRARKMLYLTSYESKDSAFETYPSSFLKDIDSKLLNCVDGSIIATKTETTPMRGKANLQLNDRVHHKAFGEGVVVGIDEGSQTYEIHFEAIDSTRRIQFRAKLIHL